MAILIWWTWWAHCSLCPDRKQILKLLIYVEIVWASVAVGFTVTVCGLEFPSIIAKKKSWLLPHLYFPLQCGAEERCPVYFHWSKQAPQRNYFQLLGENITSFKEQNKSFIKYYVAVMARCHEWAERCFLILSEKAGRKGDYSEVSDLEHPPILPWNIWSPRFSNKNWKDY